MFDLLLLLIYAVVVSLGIAVGIYTVTRLISAAYSRSKYETLLMLSKRGHFYG
jgi:hypothetical protein